MAKYSEIAKKRARERNGKNAVLNFSSSNKNAEEKDFLEVLPLGC